MTVVLIIKNCNTNNISLESTEKVEKYFQNPGARYITDCHLFPISFGKNYLHTYIVSNNGGKIVRANGEHFFCHEKKSTNFFSKDPERKGEIKIILQCKSFVGGTESFMIERK